MRKTERRGCGAKKRNNSNRVTSDGNYIEQLFTGGRFDAENNRKECGGKKFFSRCASTLPKR